MKVCYFGIYNRELSRNRVYMKGLRENNVTIIECQDDSGGPLKFIKLFLKHWKIRNDYDVLVVGHPGHIVVALAKLISKKKIVFDMAWSMYEGVIISRKQYSNFSPRTFYIKFIDWLSVKCADLILVESEAQKKYLKTLFGENKKYRVIYHGADDSDFYVDDKIKKQPDFTVVFRGKFLPEAGVRHIIEAAKILENEVIKFLIIGHGFLEDSIKAQMTSLNLSNLILLSSNFSGAELSKKMLIAHVSLGQLEDHVRLERTIPFKCFESIALGLPYITTASAPINEILKDGESALFVKPADSHDLAEKILYLKNNPEIAKKIGENGYKIYKNKFTPKILAQKIIQEINSIN